MENFNNKIDNLLKNILKNSKFNKPAINFTTPTSASIDYTIDNKVISKYIINRITLKELNALTINSATLKEYQDKYISSIFYRIEDDLGWNLYMVFVISDEEYMLLPSGVKYSIERDELYARKIIVSESEFNRVIPVGQIIDIEEDNEVIDPIQEWNKVLIDKNLQFCLESYSSSNLEKYYNNQYYDVGFNNDYCEIDKSKVNKEKLTIDTLKLGHGFREYCFDNIEEMKFGRVNLLTGANGCGKTSVLEAIELAMTGEIRKGSNNIENSNLYQKDKASNTQVKFDNEEYITVPQTTKVEKERELFYYQNKEKRISKLNTLFHQYNYFSIESVFNFCYLDNQPNYNDEFSKVIFGETAKTLEKNLNRYKEAFEYDFKNLEKSVLKDKQELSDLQKKIKLTSLIFNIDSLIHMLEKINHRNTNFNSQNSYERIKSELSNLKNILLETKINTSNLYKSTGFNSNSEILNRYNEIVEKEILLDLDLNNLKKTEIELKEKINIIKKNYTIFEKEKINSVQQYTELKNKKEELEKYNYIFENRTKSNEVLILTKLINKNKEKISKLKFVQTNWGKLSSNKDFQDNNIELLEKNTLNLESELQINQLKMNELDEKINFNTEKKHAVLNVINRIKGLGRQFVNDNPEINSCPLCGQVYENHLILSNKVVNDIMQEEFDDIQLIHEHEQQKRLIEENKQLIAKYRKQIDDYNKLKEAYQYIIDHKLIDVQLDLQVTRNTMHQILIKALDQLDKYITDEANFSSKLKEYISEGIEYTRVVELLKFIEVETDIEYGLLEKDVVEQLHKEYSNKLFQMKLQCKKLDNVIVEYHNELSQIQEIYDENQRDKTEKSKELSKCIEEKTLLAGCRENIIETSECGIINLWKGTYLQLEIYIEDIISEVDRISDTVNNNIEAKAILDNIEDKKSIIHNKQEQMNKCEQALAILYSLKGLDWYCEKFINDNIEEISDIFISLHSPRDFEKLALDANGKIIGYRKSKELQEVPIQLMSTGQRSAVVISIFIRMHMIMKSAPNFILLDEPVANIDDMNVLALFDFLRELSNIYDTQIFFTTANEYIAKLFKKKFSYLEDMFYEYKFERHGGEKSIIKRRNYNMKFDEPKIEITV